MGVPVTRRAPHEMLAPQQQAPRVLTAAVMGCLACDQIIVCFPGHRSSRNYGYVSRETDSPCLSGGRRGEVSSERVCLEVERSDAFVNGPGSDS